jgi:DNA-binding NarL/FixJ family response regulator
MDDAFDFRAKWGPGTSYGLDELELSVLVLVADGQTNREIASALGLEIASVKNTVMSIIRKLERGKPGPAFPPCRRPIRLVAG